MPLISRALGVELDNLRPEFLLPGELDDDRPLLARATSFDDGAGDACSGLLELLGSTCNPGRRHYEADEERQARSNQDPSVSPIRVEFLACTAIEAVGGSGRW
ncbi:MAG TPA: hypothetical protein VGV93_11820 [Acidimicrobiales bacterium]|nr:hypothetical protein [Acidimicrobiales bacterium]